MRICLLRRIQNTHRGRQLKFFFNGQAIEAFEGETVAAALLAAGRTMLRRTPRYGMPRGLFCGMGACFDCVMSIDGRSNQRACLTPVIDGMRVEILLPEKSRGPSV
jgi:predicted molibdopterin-dependent oxidoreductase YjgC